ncbi:MAG TPA: CBS domain-containing protein [Polyangiaceae bacterium]|nr:CBS domain-containing protein [Polyangiaceae bacterium]
MSKPIPSISKYMTTVPRTIDAESTLMTATRLMREGGFRHLPVVQGERLLGLITERDVRLVESFDKVDAATMTVGEAMSEPPYSVGPETPLDEVVNTMAEHKYGSAVIVQNGKVVGVFTTVDACRALSELLNSRLRKS